MSIFSFPEFLKTFTEIKPLSNFEIIEKCKELEIEVFFMFGFKNQPGNSFQKLITKLNQLEKRNSL